MKEKIEIKLKSELDSLLIENERNLSSLKEQMSEIEEIESCIYNETKLDIKNLSIEIQKLKFLRRETEEWNVNKNLNLIIHKSIDGSKFEELDKELEEVYKKV
jgi:hypothetical protein